MGKFIPDTGKRQGCLPTVADMGPLRRYINDRATGRKRLGAGNLLRAVQTMTSGAALDIRRKRLKFRAWHRGMREVDLLLGRFADAFLEGMDEEEVAQLEALLDVPDPEILAWITGEAAVPPEKDFRDTPADRDIPSRHGSRLMQHAKSPSVSGLPAIFDRPGPVTLAAVPDGMVGKVLARPGGEPGRPPRLRRARRPAACRGRADRPLLRARHRVPRFPGLGLPALRPRLAALGGGGAAHGDARAADRSRGDRPPIVLTTVNAVLQRVPLARFVAARLALAGRRETASPMDDLVRWLEDNGFIRTATVREPGEYAVRGGILDLFAAGEDEPVRLDFFGDTLETIRSFDPETPAHASTPRKRIDLVPANEMVLSPETIARFRERYVAMFGAADRERPPLPVGQRRPALCRHGALAAALRRRARDAVRSRRRCRRWCSTISPTRRSAERLDQIADHYQARVAALEGGHGGRRAVQAAPARTALPDQDRVGGAPRRAARWRASRPSPSRRRRASSTSAGAAAGTSPPSGTPATSTSSTPSSRHVGALQKAGKRVVVACWSEGSRDRMGQVLVDHGLTGLKPVGDWPEAQALPRNVVGARRPRARGRLRDRRPRGHRRAGHPRRPPGPAARSGGAPPTT